MGCCRTREFPSCASEVSLSRAATEDCIACACMTTGDISPTEQAQGGRMVILVLRGNVARPTGLAGGLAYGSTSLASQFGRRYLGSPRMGAGFPLNNKRSLPRSRFLLNSSKTKEKERERESGYAQRRRHSYSWFLFKGPQNLPQGRLRLIPSYSGRRRNIPVRGWSKWARGCSKPCRAP